MKNFLRPTIVLGLLLTGFTVMPVSTHAANSTDTSLPQYVKAQKEFILSKFTSGYANVYEMMSKTGLTILKTPEYQSLVCLGVMPKESLLVQLQKEKLTLKNTITQNFANLENKVSQIEESQSLGQNLWWQMFATGSYLQAQNAMRAEIDTAVRDYQSAITAFQSGYQSKARELINNYALYSAQNKDLVKTIGAKITKVNAVISGARAIDASLDELHTALGASELLDKISAIKSSAQSSLSKQIDGVVSGKLKIYKNLSGIVATLEQDKANSLTRYANDIDEYIKQGEKTRYNYGQYVSLQNKLTDYRNKYYPNQSLNCDAVIASVDDGSAALNAEILKVKADIASGVQLAKQSSAQATYKTKLLSGVMALYNTNAIKTRLKAFQDTLKASIAKLTAVKTTNTTPPVSNVDTGTDLGGPEPTSPVVQTIPAGFQFTRPINDKQKSKEVLYLQYFLSANNLYTGALDSIYTPATKAAVYAFQLQQGILTSKSNVALRGLVGPSTRKVINKLLTK